MECVCGEKSALCRFCPDLAFLTLTVMLFVLIRDC
jgi:hypothetical protein